MRYEEWKAVVPPQIRGERIWEFFGYHKALFLYAVCWKDCEALLKHPLGKTVAQQLVRSAGSISANIEEGYGRGHSLICRFPYGRTQWPNLVT